MCHKWGKAFVWNKLTDSGIELLQKASFLDDHSRFIRGTNIIIGDWKWWEFSVLTCSKAIWQRYVFKFRNFKTDSLHSYGIDRLLFIKFGVRCHTVVSLSDFELKSSVSWFLGYVSSAGWGFAAGISREVWYLAMQEPVIATSSVGCSWMKEHGSKAWY